MTQKSKTLFVIFFFTLSLLTGCGFQLRGHYGIRSTLKLLQIQPHDPYSPFQRLLKKSLESNGIQISQETTDSKKSKETPTLYITSQTFNERTIAYGTDGQTSRALLQFKVVYQILDPTQKINDEQKTIEVERELTVNPNAILGTENDRTVLTTHLYRDAVSQLIRQLSFL